MGPSSIMSVHAVRVARLESDGTPDFNNSSGGFILCGGIGSFQHDFDTDEGEDIFEKDAAGNACVIRKYENLVKRATFSLTMCKSDYRLDEILGVAEAILDGSNVVGRTFHAAQGCGEGETFPGVSIEVWSDQWDCDQPLSNAPYMRTILPRAYLTPAGFTREAGVAMPVYNGYVTPNDNWGDGPFGDADLLSSTTGWVLADMDAEELPQCPGTIGYINVPGSAS